MNSGFNPAGTAEFSAELRVVEARPSPVSPMALTAVEAFKMVRRFILAAIPTTPCDGKRDSNPCYHALNLSLIEYNYQY